MLRVCSIGLLLMAFHCLTTVLCAQSSAKSVTAYQEALKLKDKDPKAALEQFDTALQNTSSIDSTVLILFQKTNIYRSLGRYDAALDASTQILKVKRDSKNPLYFPNIWNLIGSIYKDYKKYDQALNNYQTAYRTWEGNSALVESKNQSKYLYTGADLLNNIGTVKELQGALDSAQHFYSAAIKQMDKTESTQTSNKIVQSKSALYKSNLAGILIKQGSYAQATQVLEAALSIRTKLEDQKGQMSTLKLLGKCELEMGKIKSAKEQLLKALQIAEAKALVSEQLDIKKTLSIAFSKQADYKNAFNRLLETQSLQDSIFENEKRLAFAESDILLQDQVDSLKIESLEKTNRIQELVSERQARWLWFAGLFLSALGLGMIYIINRNRLLAKERSRSESLLHNILPKETSEELKAKGSVAPRAYESVTILFADIVDFTGFSHELQQKPEQIIEELNTIYTQFDQMLETYNIEKIKTIGDAYMAASGLPEANPDHANNMILFAQAITAWMKSYAKQCEESGKPLLRIRTGIHSGRIMAGVVGKRKFVYDIFGDAVNVAARMEQASTAGRINVSAATHHLVQSHFNFESRGMIAVKGKGKMEMYFLED